MKDNSSFLSATLATAACAAVAAAIAMALAEPAAAEDDAQPQDRVTVALPEGFLERIDPSETIRAMASLPSRLTGSKGCDEAADLIRRRFEEIGLDDVREQTFSVPVPGDRGASLAVGETTCTLHAVWPNLGRAPKTPLDGVSGRLIYAGGGRPADFGGQDPAGSIALLDFNCGTLWLNLAQFGAAAIVFIEPLDTNRKEAEDKFLMVPAPVLRYYLPRGDAMKLLAVALGEEVTEANFAQSLAALKERPRVNATVKADTLWENRTARNIVGTIVGSDPELRKETVVVESFYDSTSAIPALAPGAESSCGIATLLELAKVLKANPPQRTVRFLATSAHFQALAGMRSWCREYWVWESLMTSVRTGLDEKLFAPPRVVWPTTEEIANLPRGESQPAWQADKHPIMYVSLDLSSRSNVVGIFFKGHYYDLGGTDNETIHRKRFSNIGADTLLAASALARDYGVRASLVSCIDPIRGRDWRSYAASPIALDNEVPLLYGKAEIGFVTVNDSRTYVDTPLDTVDRVDLAAVREQARLVAGLVWEIVSPPAERRYAIPPGDSLADEFYARLQEQSLIKFLPGSALPNSLLVARINTQKALMGVRGPAMAMSDQNGDCVVTGFVRGITVPVFGCRADSADGSIAYIAADQGVFPRSPTIASRDWQTLRTLDAGVAMFECSSITVFDVMDQLSYRTFKNATVLQAKTDSPPEPQNVAMFFGLQSDNSSYSEPCATFFLKREETHVKIIVTTGTIGAKFVLVNSPGAQTLADSQGFGYPLADRENFVFLTAYRAAQDMWNLNHYRLENLRRTGVRNERAEFLHKGARKRLDLATAALAQKDYAEFLNNAREAWAYEARAYPNVRGAADDVIKGLIFYLAVLLPFAVFAERLIFTFSDIRKRIFGIAGMFALIYAVLSLVHPGFKLTTNPVIILAGFFMLVLGLVTIGILLSKFNTQMALMREKAGVWHRQDVARGSAAGAAFMLGISNLRRRKTRTFLTCVTLVLLTFTVLSFTSFETSVAPNEIPTDYDTTYPGVLIRRHDWLPIEEQASLGLQDYFAGRGAATALRLWYTSENPNEYMQLDIVRADDPALACQARGILGLEPQEKALTAVDGALLYGQWFDASQEGYPNVCLLPHSLAGAALRITQDNYSGVRVRINGRELRVAGVYDSAKFGRLKDLDNESLTPVDYKAQALSNLAKDRTSKVSVSSTGELQQLPEERPPDRYEHIDAGAVAVVPAAFLRTFESATIRSVGVVLPGLSEDDILHVLREYVPRTRLILFAGMEQKVKLFSSRDALSAKGMQALFLPIAIAALIVLNTMLGSVYERLREIAVYTSCGLAPVHVAALFFAESSVFATIGAVLGYLLGQGVAKLVTVTGRLPGINLNYSSVSAVYTILLVVVVVLLSTLYPARKAVQLSVPDETKKMKLPRPTGNVWEFDFPFTVSTYEALGLSAFIHDYYASHHEDSGGVFCADSVSLTAADEKEGTRYILDSTVWVEPMDIGISQKVVLETLPPPPNELACTIKFTIHRLSGEVETWRRMNMGFLKAIRKQMLIWRLVDREHKEQYEADGRKILEKAAAV